MTPKETKTLIKLAEFLGIREIVKARLEKGYFEIAKSIIIEEIKEIKKEN